MLRDPLQILLLVLLLVAPASLAGAQGVAVGYLYNLSDFSGTIPFNQVGLHVDRDRDELYVMDGDTVRIFNGYGMEVYRFGPDLRLGVIADLAVAETGDILVLSPGLGRIDADAGLRVVRCNYRGEPISHIELSGLPEAFHEFRPEGMVYHAGRLHLLDRRQMLLAVTDIDGAFQKGYDLAELAAIPEEERKDTAIFGFTIDDAGNMVFTVPLRFRAYIVSPEGQVSAFGKAGSAAGSFGLTAGIVRDDDGNYIVADTRRSVVSVFDRDYNFVREFGYLGSRPGNLVRPSGLGLGNAGKVYVTQRSNRGVSAFSVLPN